MTRSSLTWPDSVDRKVARATKHLDDLKDVLAPFGEPHAYKVVREEKKTRAGRRFRFYAYSQVQPSPDIAVIVGDIAHNLRSALDHLAVALAPKGRKYQAGFPIEFENIWDRNPLTGDYIESYENKRVTYASKVKGMSDAAKALIDRVQPFRHAIDREVAPLGVLSRIANADKHRELVVLTVGLIDMTMVLTSRRDGARWGVHVPPGPCKDGAIVTEYPMPKAALSQPDWQAAPPDLIALVRDPDAEMDMDINGAVQVAVFTGNPPTNFPVPGQLEKLLQFFTEVLLPLAKDLFTETPGHQWLPSTWLGSTAKG